MTRRDALIDKVRKAYVRAYGRQPDRLVAAPGRVNLIGEHCDYNEGLVLPCAIDRETIVAIGESDDANMRVLAVDMNGDTDMFALGQPIVRAGADWKNHVRGVSHALVQRGIVLRPANIAIAGDVPIGAGLSSSASLGVATAMVLALHSKADFDPVELAHIAQEAENDFAGCACGIMDQMASACGVEGAAILLDCRTLQTRSVPIPEGWSLTIVDSGIRRTLTGSVFNYRRAECERAAAHYGIDVLRDLNEQALQEGRGMLADIPFRRARHVVREIERVRQTIDAFAGRNIERIGALMAASHESLRDDFEVTIAPIDQLAEMLAAVIGSRGGVRMTGAGFGGCLVAVVEKGAVQDIQDCVNRDYNAQAEIAATVGEYAPSAGARIIE